MGKRDYRHREPKKQKKDTKKIVPTTTILSPPMTVEVVKKPRKEKGEDEE